MEMQIIEAAEAAPALPAFTIEPKPLAQALAALASLLDRRNTIPVLACVLIEAEPGSIRLTTTDVGTTATIRLDPLAVERPGRVALPARALAGMIKGLTKSASTVEITAEPKDTGALATVAGGRARFNLAGELADGFPLAVERAPSEEWELSAEDAAAPIDPRAPEGLTLPAEAEKMLAKAIKRAKGAGASVARFDPPEPEEGVYSRPVHKIRATIGDMTVTAALLEPEAGWGYRKHDPFQYDVDAEEARKAWEYLRTLRQNYGLPIIEDHEGSPVSIGGRAVAMTFGSQYWDSSEYVDADDFTPPEGTTITGGAFQECEVAGVKYARLHGQPWKRWRVGTDKLLYPEGAYSVFIPRAERPCLAETFVDVDGERVPLRLHESSGKLELSADQVRKLCGDVADMPRVDIPKLTLWHGDIVEGVTLPAAPTVKDGRRLRKMTDREQLAAYCADPAGTIASLQPVRVDQVERENAAASAIEAFAWAIANLPEPSNVVRVDFTARAAAETAQEALAAASGPAEPGERSVASEAVPCPVEAVGEMIGEMLAAVMARMDRLEAGIGTPAMESPAPSVEKPQQAPRAVRERMVRRYLAMRRQRELDRSALMASGEQFRRVEAERDQARAAVATAAGDMARKARDAIAGVGAMEKRLEEMHRRALRAEQALVLYRTKPEVPAITFGRSLEARVSFEAAR